MEIIGVACVATLAICAVLARASNPIAKRVLKETSKDPLDKALFHLINEVTRKPTPRRGYVDHVMLGSRLSAHDKRTTAI
jgi:hypothetical protein